MKKYIAFLVLISYGLMGQDGVMTPQKLWELGRVGLDAVSPDGNTFVYGVSRYDIKANSGNRDLYLMNIKSGAISQLTDLAGGEYGAHFVNGGIAFNHGGQLHWIGTDGKGLKALTNVDGGVSGAKAYAMADGSLKILFSKSFKTADTPGEMYPDLPEAEFRVMDDLMYRHWDSWDDFESMQVCISSYDGSPVKSFKNLLEGSSFDSPVPPFGGSESYTLSPNGKYVVYETKMLTGKDFAEQTNSDLFLVDLSSGNSSNISEGMEGYDKNPQFSPDGSKIAWLSMATNGYESDVNDLIVLDLKTKEKKHVLKSSGLYDKYTINSFAWEDEDEFIVGIPYMGSNQIFEVEAKGNSWEFEKISKGDHNHNHFEIAKGGLLVARQDMNNATEIYFIKDNGKAKQLTHINDEIYASIGKSKVEKRMIKTSDGKDMLTWVIYPPNFDPAKKYPTLLYCQGGPQSMVSQFYSFRWNFQLMAAQGYIVVAPNRRGLPGFGREWNEKISKDWGGQPMRDYLAAIDAVAKEPYVDNDNLGCVGASYGGYSVYMLAGIHEGRFKSFISHCGLFDLESWYLSTEEMFFANYDLGGPFWEEANAASFSSFDPKDYVQNWNTPMLVIHGGKDFRVPENQGMEAFQAAKLMGVPARFLYFPNEGHWILSPQNGLVWHDQFFGWLDQWLK
ncbi:MAG: S9 family peptidase [Bacteroidetes bacterium]|nr:S9 family peptidase [Bacteroidota bacterium]